MTDDVLAIFVIFATWQATRQMLVVFDEVLHVLFLNDPIVHQVYLVANDC